MAGLIRGDMGPDSCLLPHVREGLGGIIDGSGAESVGNSSRGTCHAEHLNVENDAVRMEQQCKLPGIKTVICYHNIVVLQGLGEQMDIEFRSWVKRILALHEGERISTWELAFLTLICYRRLLGNLVIHCSIGIL